MVAERLGRLAARLVNAAEPAVEKVKASDFAQKLLTEFERGRAGEADAPDASNAHAASDAAGAPPSNPADAAAADAAASPSDPAPADDVDSLVDALSSVDWAKVRAAASEKGSGVATSMKKMAADVDWAKVQSGAAVVSSALIAAVASGQLPIGGRLAGPVARAILNDSDLASKVSSRMAGNEQPPDLRDRVQGA